MIDRFLMLIIGLSSISFADASNRHRLGKRFHDENLYEKTKNIDEDLNNLIEANIDQDSKDMETALISFYGNRQKLNEKGVDDAVLTYFDDKVDIILKVGQDVWNMIDALHKQEKENMEVAMNSFQGNRKILKVKGVNKAIIKKFEDKVDIVLRMEKLLQDKKVQETMKNMETDLKNIMIFQDSEDVEAALHSYDEHKKTLKQKGINEAIMKHFDQKVDGILKSGEMLTQWL